MKQKIFISILKEMSSTCNHMIRAGKGHFNRCNINISTSDPEKRFCAKHRICVFVEGVEPKDQKIKQEIKYLDYITFTASLITVE